MSKILENEFRKELYKNLIDADYSKEEAQRIIGRKYHDALKENVKHQINDFMAAVEAENYEATINQEELAAKMADLKNLKALLSK